MVNWMSNELELDMATIRMIGTSVDKDYNQFSPIT